MALAPVAADRLGSIKKFYPFGTERPSATANDTEKFTGYYRDASTGLDYADQRYHQPGVGRFMTTDPDSGSAKANDPGSWNRYAYVAGDPVNDTDPSGLMMTVNCDGCGGGDASYGFGGDIGPLYTIDGLAANSDVATSMLNSGFATQCPNNFCSGFASDGYGTTFVQFQASAGTGPQGYVGLTDTAVTPTSAEQTQAQEQLIMNQATAFLSSLPLNSQQVSAIISDLTLGPMVGGHLNLQVTQDNFDQAVGDPTLAALLWNAASSPFGIDLGTGLRGSSFVDALHMNVVDGIINFHIDTFNNSALFPLGSLLHGSFDFTLGRIPGVCLDVFCP